MQNVLVNFKMQHDAADKIFPDSRNSLILQVSVTPSIETSEARNDDSTIIPAELTTTPVTPPVTTAEVAVVAARANVADLVHPAHEHHSAQIDAIDVACG